MTLSASGPTIETARLLLRRHLPSDAEWIAQEIARPEVHSMLTAPPHPYRLTDAQEWIARVGTDPAHRVIEMAGRPVGVITCDARDRDETLGYWLRRAAWGQGIMTEAAGAMLARHFEAGADVATSGYIANNAASARVLTKLGFVEDGVVRRFSGYRGAMVDIQRMILTRARWQAATTS